MKVKVTSAQPFTVVLDDIGYLTVSVSKGDVVELSNDHGESLIASQLAERAPEDAVATAGAPKAPKAPGKARSKKAEPESKPAEDQKAG